MLRISPFNDYSGQYSATAYKVYFKGNEKEAIVPEYHTSYVIDDKTIFFYAGLIDIDRLDRKYYKIKFEFTEEKIDLQTRKLKISSDNEDINLVFEYLFYVPSLEIPLQHIQADNPELKYNL